jgi:hypothetical protein
MVGNKERKKVNWPLEIGKFSYALLMSIVLFLFFTLLLDAFCLLAFGSWNSLLGSWPIFSGTVNSAFYSPWAHVLSLVMGQGIMARIILGGRTPYILSFLEKNPAHVPGDDIH